MADKSNTSTKLSISNNEPSGTYQVWHRYGEAYRHVANVEAGNYMAAVVLPLFERGAPGTERVTWLIDLARPTTHGDKIVDPLGAAYEIYKPDFGGTALREASIPEAKPLVGRENALSAELARPSPDDRPPHPWPSEIAEANRHQPSEKDQGKDSGSEKANGNDTGHSM